MGDRKRLGLALNKNVAARLDELTEKLDISVAGLIECLITGLRDEQIEKVVKETRLQLRVRAKRRPISDATLKRLAQMDPKEIERMLKATRSKGGSKK